MDFIYKGNKYLLTQKERKSSLVQSTVYHGLVSFVFNQWFLSWGAGSGRDSPDPDPDSPQKSFHIRQQQNMEITSFNPFKQIIYCYFFKYN